MPWSSTRQLSFSDTEEALKMNPSWDFLSKAVCQENCRAVETCTQPFYDRQTIIYYFNKTAHQHILHIHSSTAAAKVSNSLILSYDLPTVK